MLLRKPTASLSRPPIYFAIVAPQNYRQSSTYEFYATKPPVTDSEPESQVQVECDPQLLSVISIASVHAGK